LAIAVAKCQDVPVHELNCSFNSLYVADQVMFISISLDVVDSVACAVINGWQDAVLQCFDLFRCFVVEKFVEHVRHEQSSFIQIWYGFGKRYHGEEGKCEFHHVSLYI